MIISFVLKWLIVSLWSTVLEFPQCSWVERFKCAEVWLELMPPEGKNDSKGAWSHYWVQIKHGRSSSALSGCTQGDAHLEKGQLTLNKAMPLEKRGGTYRSISTRTQGYWMSPSISALDWKKYRICDYKMSGELAIIKKSTVLPDYLPLQAQLKSEDKYCTIVRIVSQV